MFLLWVYFRGISWGSRCCRLIYTRYIQKSRRPSRPAGRRPGGLALGAGSGPRLGAGRTAGDFVCILCILYICVYIFVYMLYICCCMLYLKCYQNIIKWNRYCILVVVFRKGRPGCKHSRWGPWIQFYNMLYHFITFYRIV